MSETKKCPKDFWNYSINPVTGFTVPKYLITSEKSKKYREDRIKFLDNL